MPGAEPLNFAQCDGSARRQLSAVLAEPDHHFARFVERCRSGINELAQLLLILLALSLEEIVKKCWVVADFV